MVDQFLHHIERNQLCKSSDSILLAVSGGLDSTVMLYLFREAGFQFSVAHCNFQLRGKDSNDDELFVTTLCKELKITLHTKRFETEAYAWEKTLSTQMAARELRYDWFRDLVEKHRYTFVATAHHVDDSIETVLLNLTRGTGTDGLIGIPVKNEHVIRPLLFTTRKQIEQYALHKGLVWREDLSNLTDDYQRNFIRHQIIPRLKELNPSLQATWLQGLEKVKGDVALLSRAYQDWKGKYIKASADRVVIDKQAFDEYPGNASLLWRYIRTFGFNFDQATEVLNSLYGQSGKRFLSHSHILVIDRDTLIMTDRGQLLDEKIIEQGETESFLGPWTLKISSVQDVPEMIDQMNIVLDEEQLTFPLIWRKWRAGDFFYPLGLGHRKKLSDYLIDSKVPRADKDQVTVLESEGRIVWVAGYRIDDRFKLTPETRSKIKLTLWRMP